jgi:energy-coupling factor transport system ATP-binding protein
MIVFDRFSFQYPNARVHALRNVTLSIEAGAFALVIGPSGCGKSTLLRALNGLTPHFSGGQVTGSVRINGLDPIALGVAAMSRHTGFVFQNPEAQQVTDIVEDEITFGLENAGMPRQEMRIRVEEALDLLDLAPLRDRRVETLSGGERQRVAIAAALALRPSVLVLDEPTSQLDPKSAEDVLMALTRLNADLGLTVVLSEHRLERVLPFADTCVVFDERPNGAAQVRCAPPRDAATWLSSPPPLLAVAMRLGWTPTPLTIKEARRFRARPVASVRTATPPPRPVTDVAGRLRTTGLSADYGGAPALLDVSLTVRSGSALAVLGRNGSGKSTLLRCLIGLTKPKRGDVYVDGVRVTAEAVAARSRVIGYLPQDPNALLFADTVRDEVAMTLRNHRLPVDDSAIDSLLRALGIAPLATAYPRDLSAGERQRVALAAIAITNPRVLLLDEPTRGIDAQSKLAMAAWLRDRRAAGCAVVLVTHDVEFAAQVTDRALLLSQGRELASGSTREILGASPFFATQVARLFPGTGWLTPEDVTHVTDA